MKFRGPLSYIVSPAEGPLSRVTVFDGGRIERDVHVPSSMVNDELEAAVRGIESRRGRRLPGVN
jgi:hypothetical protein